MTVRLFALVCGLLAVLAVVGFAQSGGEESTTSLRKRGRAALKALKKDADPAHVRTAIALIERLRAERKASEAGRYLKQLAKLAPENLEVQLYHAEHLKRTGKIKPAERLAGRALEQLEDDTLRIRALRVLEIERNVNAEPLKRLKSGGAIVVRKTTFPLPKPKTTCVFSRAGGITDHDRKDSVPCESCAQEFTKRLPR